MRRSSLYQILSLVVLLLLVAVRMGAEEVPPATPTEPAAASPTPLEGNLDDISEALLQPERSTSEKSKEDTSLKDVETSLGDLEKAISEEGDPIAKKSNVDKQPIPEDEAQPIEKNEISNLEFKMDGDVSKIIVTFRRRPMFTEARNPSAKQIVYLFQNTEANQRLQRAYDTSEFNSPISLFTMIQMPSSSPPLTKLIVQLREDKLATATIIDRRLIIDLPPPDGKYEIKVASQEPDPRVAVEENIYATGKIFSGKEIERLEIKNSDIQDVLRLIARTSGYNVLIGDDVQGKVGTISFQRVPWDQAFTFILQSKKLGYIRQGNVLRIATLGNLKSEKDEALANEQARLKVEPLRTLLVPISYAKAAELAPRAKSFLSERGVIETDIRTNTVIVKDVEKIVNRVHKLLLALDTQPPRVSISARVVEMLQSFTRNIGFANVSFSGLNLGGINIDSALSPSVSGGASTTTITAPNFANLMAQLQLGELEGKSRILANPSVSVVANQTAQVNQSLSFFVPTTEIAGGVVVNTLRQITANLILDVNPIVSGDGSIFMNVNVKNEIPRGSGATRTIDARSLTTQVLVENGDTAVIGGVFNSTETVTREGIPFLMDIPILGFLVSNRQIEDTRNEVFIFLTAKILNAEESFKKSL